MSITSVAHTRQPGLVRKDIIDEELRDTCVGVMNIVRRAQTVEGHTYPVLFVLVILTSGFPQVSICGKYP